MSERLRVLDVLRGMAIAGIVLVNVPDMLFLGASADRGGSLRSGLDLLVQSRLVPIFEVLFGVGMYLIVRSARARGLSPWPPMLLRLTALFGIGLVHALVYPGEILRFYAIAGLLVLPVVLLTPRAVQLVLGAAATGVVVALAGSSAVGTPGMILLGAAGAAYGVPAVLERAGRPVWWVLAIAVPVAAVALYRQTLEPGDPRFSTAGGQAGMAMAVVYVAGTALLLAGPLRGALTAVFAPLGRMALTSYLTASLVVVPAGAALGLTGSGDLPAALVLGAAVVAVQCVACRLWLWRARYGPVEWVWRAVTWRTRPQAPALPVR